MLLFQKRPTGSPGSPERAALIEGYAKEALLLSARLKRPMTPSDLYMILYVPWDLVDQVMTAITDVHAVALELLSPEELARLERDSQSVIIAIHSADSQHLETEGLNLSDVAVHSPDDWTLDQIKKLFEYIITALRMKSLPSRGAWTSEVQELARRASTLPSATLSVYGLVRELEIGVYHARLVRDFIEESARRGSRTERAAG